MEIIISDTYDALSTRAADEVMRLMSSKANPVLCVASGDSPAGLYRHMIQRVNNDHVDILNWHFVGLDEWSGMNAADEGSCRYNLNEQLFHPLGVNNIRISFFDGRNDPVKECDHVETFIRQLGGIDVAILGLGMNGHVGMNEPGTPRSSRSHLAQLDPITQKVGQKYFKDAQLLTSGVTLGIDTLMEAKHILLIVNGERKAGIVRRVIEEEISEQLPATLLRDHPAFSIYLDREAAAQILQAKT